MDGSIMLPLLMVIILFVGKYSSTKLAYFYGFLHPLSQENKFLDPQQTRDLYLQLYNISEMTRQLLKRSTVQSIYLIRNFYVNELSNNSI